MNQKNFWDCTIYIDDNGQIYGIGKDGDIDYRGRNADIVIQNVIKDHAIIGGRTFIMPGRYPLVNNGIILPGGNNEFGGKNPSFIIQGSGSSTILYNQSTDPAITIKAQNSAVRDIRIDGNNTNSGDGILITPPMGVGGGNYNQIQNVYLKNNNNGLTIQGACYENTILGLSSLNNRNFGISLQTLVTNNISFTPNANTFINSTCNQNGGHGLSINKGNANYFVGYNCATNGGYGLYINDDSNIFFGVYTEKNLSGGIFTDIDVTDTMIFHAANGDGYTFSDPRNTYFRSTNFYIYSGTISNSLTTGTLTTTSNVNIKPIKTVLNGATAGSLTWAIPLGGTNNCYTKFVGYFSGYQNNTGIPQIVTYSPVFSHSPVIIKDASGKATSTNTTLTLPINMAVPVSGWIIIEGF